MGVGLGNLLPIFRGNTTTYQPKPWVDYTPAPWAAPVGNVGIGGGSTPVPQPQPAPTPTPATAQLPMVYPSNFIGPIPPGATRTGPPIQTTDTQPTQPATDQTITDQPTAPEPTPPAPAPAPPPTPPSHQLQPEITTPIEDTAAQQRAAEEQRTREELERRRTNIEAAYQPIFEELDRRIGMLPEVQQEREQEVLSALEEQKRGLERLREIGLGGLTEQEKAARRQAELARRGLELQAGGLEEKARQRTLENLRDLDRMTRQATTSLLRQ